MIRSRSGLSEYLLVAALFATVVASLVLINYATAGILSAVRAYVAGEGLYAKGQKDAVYHLSRYAASHDDDDYQAYRRAIAVPLADQVARLALLEPEPDLHAARQGLLVGRNHPQDIAGLIFVFRYLRWLPEVSRAIEYWTEGDGLINRLDELAGELREHVRAGTATPEWTVLHLEEIDRLNQRLSRLEDDFSFTLGGAARRLRTWATGITAGAAFAILALAVLVAWRLLNRIKQSEDRYRRTSEDLRRVNRDLREFASVASHDLQEPLQSLVLFASLVRDDEHSRLSENAHKYLQGMVESAYHMRELIRSLLSLSLTDLSTPKLEPLQVAQCVDRALEGLRVPIEQTGAKIEREPLPVVTADATLLTQIYRNLISNALKFSGREAPVIRLTARIEEGAYVLGVQDNGMGMTHEEAERIFQPLERLPRHRKHRGVGIGLAICRSAVEHHGGRIWVESEPGRGAHFRFRLTPTPGAPSAPDWCEPGKISVV